MTPWEKARGQLLTEYRQYRRHGVQPVAALRKARDLLILSSTTDTQAKRLRLAYRRYEQQAWRLEASELLTRNS
jgi:hypothetical protein